MSLKTLPYVRWYTDRYLEGETREELTNAQRGIYFDLINRCYRGGVKRGPETIT